MPEYHNTMADTLRENGLDKNTWESRDVSLEDMLKEVCIVASHLASAVRFIRNEMIINETPGEASETSNEPDTL